MDNITEQHRENVHEIVGKYRTPLETTEQVRAMIVGWSEHIEFYRGNILGQWNNACDFRRRAESICSEVL
jgi:hypothetical protein